tara:strand:+ start:223 stop:432 length:210 start_codon:yes stop_codon:yes gene_type:complete
MAYVKNQSTINEIYKNGYEDGFNKQHNKNPYSNEDEKIETNQWKIYEHGYYLGLSEHKKGESETIGSSP